MPPSFMSKKGPPESARVVPGGTLLYRENRDAAFPYLYQVKDHPLDPTPEIEKTILVYIQDTSPKAMKALGKFEDGLSVPLGPDGAMAGIGLIDLEPPLAIFARCQGADEPRDDVLVAFVADSKSICTELELSSLESVIEDIQGDPEQMSVNAPRKGSSGKLRGGLHFERLGQKGVKGTRCYSLSQTYQHSRSLLGPTAGGKVYEGSESENESLRRRAVEAGAQIAMKALRTFAPKDFMEILEINVETNNIPRIGVHENVAFPSVQLNIAPAVAQSECKKKGLQGMGFFADAHKDKLDSAGSLTCMLSCSNVPDDYEAGRFHLLHLGCFVRLRTVYAMGFSGLHAHGGSPPIAPKGSKVSPKVARKILVFYPTDKSLSATTPHVTPFASLPNGQLLKMGPEITSIMALHEQTFTAEANWVSDGSVLMRPFTHFQHVSRLALQLLDHIWKQLPAEYEALLDAQAFFRACTMKVDGERVDAGSWAMAPDGAAADTYFNPDSPADVENAIVARRDQAMAWIAHVEKCSQFIPGECDTDFDHEREKISNGVITGRRRGKEARKSARSTLQAEVEQSPDESDEGTATLVGSRASNGVATSPPKAASNIIADVTRSLPLQRRRRHGSVEPDPEGETEAPVSDAEHDAQRASPVREVDTADRTSEFMESLAADEMDELIAQLELCISLRSEESSQGSADALSSCHDVIRMIRTDPASSLTTEAVSSLSPRLENMKECAELLSLNTRMLRSAIMLSEVLIVGWYEDAIDVAARNGKDGAGWAWDLVQHLYAILRDSSSKGTRTLDSREFMPAVEPLEYRFTVPRYSRTSAKVSENVANIAKRATRAWLRLTNDASAVVRGSLLRTLLGGSTNRMAILYLSPVWSMYTSPFHKVIHGHARQNRSTKHTRTVLRKFGEAFKAHPLSDPSSELCHKLMVMNSLIETLESPPSKSPHFSLSYLLRILLPLANDEPYHSGHPLVEKVNDHLDYYLPFRSKAPSLSRALRVIYSDHDRLKTSSGLFNMLAFRGVFFGSEFAREDLCWYEYDWDFDEDYMERMKHDDTPERYFVDMTAYGSAQSIRTTHLMNDYGTTIFSSDDWERWLESNPDRPHFDLFKYFCKFRNIGPLSALLLVGDLAESGFIAMPSTTTMANLIVKVNKGAMAGLRRLGLIRDDPDVEIVARVLF